MSAKLKRKKAPNRPRDRHHTGVTRRQVVDAVRRLIEAGGGLRSYTSQLNPEPPGLSKELRLQIEAERSDFLIYALDKHPDLVPEWNAYVERAVRTVAKRYAV